MLTLEKIFQIIHEEVHVIVEADTRLFYPGERARASRARKRKGTDLTPEERELIKLTSAPPDHYRRETVYEPPEDLETRIGRATRGDVEHKTVDPEDVTAFKMYRKLYYQLLDLTEEQRLWLAGDVAGRGTIPREVLRKEVPDILDDIEKIENNEVDPELQDRLSRYQAAAPDETPEEKEAREWQYNSAVREFNLWRDRPYELLNKWLKTMRGMDTAIEYNIFDMGGDEETDFPGGEEAAKEYKQIFTDKTAVERYLLDRGYNIHQLAYYLQDPEGIFGNY